ncbi:hypothetical protein [Actinomyces oris]|uniref:hypothetical protein n=1 Tax=Actinomyces oris TaxID=544580 RepID=UPI0028F0ABD3|nr:hypothetical protein [Actinomyces oris]
MVKAPILKAQQDLSNLGKEPAAAPFDANGTMAIASKQLTILRVAADRREALVALNPSSSSSYAAWQVPIPDNLAGQHLNCRMNAKTFDCGDQISVDLASGINSPAKPSTVSAADSTTSPSQEPTGSSTPDDPASSTALSTATPEHSSETSSSTSTTPASDASATPSAAPSASGTPTSAPSTTSVR